MSDSRFQRLYHCFHLSHATHNVLHRLTGPQASRSLFLLRIHPPSRRQPAEQCHRSSLHHSTVAAPRITRRGFKMTSDSLPSDRDKKHSPTVGQVRCSKAPMCNLPASGRVVSCQFDVQSPQTKLQHKHSLRCRIHSQQCSQTFSTSIPQKVGADTKSMYTTDAEAILTKTFSETAENELK